MPPSAVNRCIVFIDGQNLYYATRAAFGVSYPNFHITNLAREVCRSQYLTCDGIRFYTGVLSSTDNIRWHTFWSNKLRSARREGVTVFTREIRSREKRITINLADILTPEEKIHIARETVEYTISSFSEKGVDVRLALDIIRLALSVEYDKAIIFSQDQDLSEVAKEIKLIAEEQGRGIDLYSAFPFSPISTNHRGIVGTKPIRINSELYNQCLDTRDYSPRNAAVTSELSLG